MDKHRDNAIDSTDRSSFETPDQAARTKKPARRSNRTQRPTPLDAHATEQVVGQAAIAPPSEPENPEVAICFENFVASELLSLHGQTLLRAPHHDIKWREIEILGRGIANTLAAICELPAERFSCSSALILHPHQAQPMVTIYLPEQASLKLRESDMREITKCVFGLLSDDALTGLTTADLSARTGLAPRCIDSIRQLRIAIPGRRLHSRIEIRIPGCEDPIIVPLTLCEPYTPKIEKVNKSYRGVFSGYDDYDREAYLRRHDRSKRIEISFDESSFLDVIREHSSPKRSIVDVDVVEALADGLPVGYELMSITVIQKELDFGPPDLTPSRDRKAKE